MVSIAPRDYVIAIFGGGGLMGEGGVSSVFGGAALFKDDVTDEHFIGVWGARKASRFRRLLSTNMQAIILKKQPSARLVFWQAEGLRTEAGEKK